MEYRYAVDTDGPMLAELNYQLVRDEGHRNPMTVAELEDRMRQWLAGEYEAVIFEIDGRVCAYALYRPDGKGIYLRQLFVVRDKRRQGIGRRAVELLFSDIWPEDKRIRVEALWPNRAAVAFWKACGFREYSLALEMMPGERS